MGSGCALIRRGLQVAPHRTVELEGEVAELVVRSDGVAVRERRTLLLFSDLLLKAVRRHDERHAASEQLDAAAATADPLYLCGSLAVGDGGGAMTAAATPTVGV